MRRQVNCLDHFEEALSVVGTVENHVDFDICYFDTILDSIGRN